MRYVYIALGALIVLEVAGFSVWGVLDQRRLEAERKAEREEVRAEEATRREQAQAQKVGKLVELSNVTTKSYATNSVVTLYFTNFSSETLIVCGQGVIMQKESAGVRLYSMPVCSGPVPSLATRSVSAPWDGGQASALCHNARGYLDWDQCDFSVINYKKKKKAE